LLDGTGRFFAKTGAGIGIYEAGFSCGAKKKSALNTLHLSQHKHAKPSKVISLSYIASEKTSGPALWRLSSFEFCFTVYQNSSHSIKNGSGRLLLDRISRSLDSERDQRKCL